MDRFKYKINFYSVGAEESFTEARVEFVDSQGIEHIFVNLSTSKDHSSTRIDIHTGFFPAMLLNTDVKESILKDLSGFKVSSNDIRKVAQELQQKIFSEDTIKSIQTYLEDAVGLPWHLEGYTNKVYQLDDFNKVYQLDDFLTDDKSALAELLDGIMDIITTVFLENYDMFLEYLKKEVEKRLRVQSKAKTSLARTSNSHVFKRLRNRYR